MRITPLTAHIGAAVEDIDITAPLDETTRTSLRAALCRRAVLIFRDQALTDAQQVTFTKALGPLEPTIPSDPIGDGGPIGVLTNIDAEGHIIPPDDKRVLYAVANTLWHSDGAFRHVPLRGSVLAAKVIPPTGGDTEFASLTAPYALLPAARKTEIADLAVEHSMAHSRAQIAPDLMSEEFLNATPPVVHPLVRTVAETGERALLVGSYAGKIIGWPSEKGAELLRDLLEWCTQPQFVYCHRWRTDDLLVYDNRCCLHRGRAWDRAAHARVLHRTTLAGDDSLKAQCPSSP